jgi:hypothetical protein
VTGVLVIGTSDYSRLYANSTSHHILVTVPLSQSLSGNGHWSGKDSFEPTATVEKKESLVFLPTCYILAVHCPYIKYLHKYSYLLMYEQL